MSKKKRLTIKEILKLPKILPNYNNKIEFLDKNLEI
jgi:hypothetical protein